MLFTDLGSYVTPAGISVLPWPVLLEAGVEGAIFKGDQEDLTRGVSTMRSIQQAYDGGAKTVGCFYWDDPTVLLSVLLDRYTRAIEREKPEFIAPDIEQWKDWAGNDMAPDYLNDHAQGLVEGLACRFPELLMMPYSANYMLSHIPGMAKWIDNYENWTAAWPDSPGPRYRMTLEEIARGDVHRTLYRRDDGSYAYDTINIRDNWQAATNQRICLLRQYSSRILLPFDRVGNTIFDHQYDWNYTPLTIDEWRKKIRPETTGEKMANIYNRNVPTSERGWFALISDEDKDIDVATLSAGVDALALRMVTQVTDNMQARKDTAFPIRAPRATCPVIAWVELDPNLFWRKEIDLDKFTDSTKRNMWNNETFRALLEQWRTVEIPDAEWAANNLNISASDGKWLKFSIMILHMTSTIYTAHGSPINGMWQQAVVDDILKPLVTLMQGGYIPAIPVYIAANHDWHRIYSLDDGWLIKNRLASGEIAGVGTMRKWKGEEPGLLTDQAPMALIVPLAEARTYVPGEVYSYPFTSDAYNFQFFIYTYNRLMAGDAFYPGSVVKPLTAGVWCDTKVEMYKTLGYTGPGEPPVEPPLSPLEERVAALEGHVDNIQALIDMIRGLLNA